MTVELDTGQDDVKIRTARRNGRWWLAHRSGSWRPVCPEAPRPSAKD
jgi:hypothetical protein